MTDTTEEQIRPTDSIETAPASCPYSLNTRGTDIHSEADMLRSQGPVQVTLPGDVKVWSLNSYNAIKQVLSDPQVTKSAREHWPAFQQGQIRPDWEMISWVAMDNMVTSHGARLRRLRRLVAKAFSSKRVDELRPHIEAVADRLLDSIEKQGEEVVDLRAAYCYPLPGMLVADMIGMSEEARVETAKVVDMMVETTVTPEEAQQVLAGWREAIEVLIEEKRQQPKADITSDLLAAHDEDGSRLTEEELIDCIFAILGAGSETTINFLDNAVSLLLRNPEELAKVRDGRATWEDVFEETLRVESPLAHLPLRYAASDIEVEGVTIPRGDPILVNYASVGRDPALHGVDAGRFDVSREDKEHLSLGFGPHYCLGSGVARAVGEIGLSALFERFPHLQLASGEALEPIPTFIMNGHQSLPVVLGGN